MKIDIQKIQEGLLFAVVLLCSLVFLPNFPDAYLLPKLMIVVTGVLALLILEVIQIVTTGKCKLALGRFDLPLLVLAATSLISAALRSPNKMEAFFVPGWTTLLIALFIIFIFIKKLTSRRKVLEYAILLGAVLANIVYLLSYVGSFQGITGLPELMKNTSFNPLGDLLTLAIFSVVSLILIAGLLISHEDIAQRLLLAVSLAVIVLGMSLGIYSLIPGKATSLKLPPLSTSWAVFTDALKAEPLLGVGTGNYLTAFSRFRNLDYNATDLWNLRFTSATNYFLTLATETGLAGVAAILLLFFALLRSTKAWFSKKDIAAASLVALVIALLVFPATLPLIMLLFVLAALTDQTHLRELQINHSARIFIGILAVVSIGFFAFWGAKAVYAEYTFKSSLDYFTQNKGKESYDTVRRAISLNPRIDRYHAAYAQINIALAKTVAQKKDITDEERQTITQLIQQGIREAKVAVTLNPQRSANWELLGKIYQSIIPFAQGADQFAIQSYTGAIAYDPYNPNLRIALGGIYYSLGRFDDAIESFKLAVVAKPNLPNAHYNLALAYREKGEDAKAIAELKAVLELLPQSSADYSLADKELKNLEANKTAKPASGEGLTSPENPQTIIEPRIDLNREATPPATTP